MHVGILNSPARLGLLAVCLLPTPLAAEHKLDRYEFLQIEMGVPFRIVLYAADDAVANQAARAAYARIERLNAVMSDYDPDSELMRLCQMSGPGKPVKVSPDLLRVLRHAVELSQKTDGAFDVTVGPLVRLWRIARRKKQMPEPAALREAQSRVGYRNVRLDAEQQTVELLRDGMRLDLGGIAKGFAGDEALAVLRRHGITRALVDGSGDVVLGDPPPGRRGWIVDVDDRVQKPPEPGAKPTDQPVVGARVPWDPPQPTRLRLSNAAVATSGDAFQFVEINGRRYSHIIDPKTGLGLTRSSSVTVIAKTGIEADSLASAVSVVGPEQGLKLLGCRTAAARIVHWRGDEMQTTRSQSFAQFVLTE